MAHFNRNKSCTRVRFTTFLVIVHSGLMVVPHMRSSTAHSRCFARVGPSAWNSLPQSLRLELLALSPSQFCRHLKTFLSGRVTLYKCSITITMKTNEFLIFNISY